MNKLLPCPFCGNTATLFTTDEIGYLGNDRFTVKCNSCFCGTGHYAGPEQAKEAWSLRTQPENKPLTLDELREMVGEPVWLDAGEVSIGEQIVGRWEILEKVTRVPREAFWFTRSKFGFTDFNHGKTWLAHRHKPKEEHHA